MTVYLIDNDGYYKGPHTCQPSPLEPGQFLKPKSGTYSDKEPTFTAGKWPRLVNGKWTLVDDKRGVDIYDIATKQKKVCSDVALPSGHTELVPGVDDKWDGKAWALDTQMRDARLAAEAKAARDALISEKMRAMAEAELIAEGKL